MNFDDTPQEAEFRNPPPANGSRPTRRSNMEAELAKASLGRIRLQKEEIVDVGKAWQKKKAEARLGLPALAEGIWRPRCFTDRDG